MVTYDLDQAAELSKVMILQEDNKSARVFSRSEFLESDLFSKKLLKLGKEKEHVEQPENDDMKMVASVLAEELSSETASKAQIIEEEVIEVGSVSWETYTRLFRMGPYGLWSIAFVVVLHIVINACNLAVSLYLALTLTERFVAADEDPERDREYNYYLCLIIIGALVSTFIGKYTSNLVFMRINRTVHD